MIQYKYLDILTIKSFNGFDIKILKDNEEQIIRLIPNEGISVKYMNDDGNVSIYRGLFKKIDTKDNIGIASIIPKKYYEIILDCSKKFENKIINLNITKIIEINEIDYEYSDEAIEEITLPYEDITSVSEKGDIIIPIASEE